MAYSLFVEVVIQKIKNGVLGIGKDLEESYDR